MANNAARAERDALLRRFLDHPVVGTQNGGTVGNGCTSIDSGVDTPNTCVELSEQRHLIGELTGASFLSVDNATVGCVLRCDGCAKIDRKVSFDVIEFLDRTHLGPIDFVGGGRDSR
uniref:Uncharacterized protein n=1 Tax=Anopheles melas TaxID=34690 RepID=A0A182TI42_9DIPT